jgi:hypothetical protein
MPSVGAITAQDVAVQRALGPAITTSQRAALQSFYQPQHSRDNLVGDPLLPISYVAARRSNGSTVSSNSRLEMSFRSRQRLQQ